MDGFMMKTPDSLKQLQADLKGAGENTYLISGGTDLIIKMRKEGVDEGTIIDLKGIKEIRYIQEENGFIRIGANTTFSEIIGSDLLKKHASCLVQAAGKVGSTQIRNAATIGGNVANAFAGADSIPALIALGAQAKIMDSSGGFRTLPLEQVLKSNCMNTLGKDEAIVEVSVPVTGRNIVSAFGKVGSRTAVTIAKLNMAAAVELSEAGEILDARIALGSLGPMVSRGRSAEDVLKGRRPSEELERDFIDMLINTVDEAIPGRASWPYKREAMRGLADDVYRRLFKGGAF